MNVKQISDASNKDCQHLFYQLISEENKTMVVNPGEQTMTMIQRIFSHGWQSVCSLTSAVAALFAPAVPAILTAFTFIAVDMHFGYKVSKKFGRTQFESNKFWKTVNKLTETALLIGAALLLDKFIFMTYENLAAVRMAAGAVCCAETLSLLESLRALHPNAKISKILAKVIKSKAEKYLDTDISELIDDDFSVNNNNKK